MATNKLLIVCFSFPPFPGIGGRRWAKFAKYLSRNGYEIHALAARNDTDQKSEWSTDIESDKIHLHTVPLGLSKVLSFTPETFIQKATHKLLSKTAPHLIKGNQFDKTYFVRQKFVKKADEIISKHGITTFIVTIPPYKLAYYLLPLKQKHPKVKFIVDYRDPWTDNRSYHGFSDISEERLTEEITYEMEVLSTYDAVLDVNSESLSVLRKRSATKNKFHHIPNGFDSEDYVSSGQSPAKTDDKIRFIYSGSFYPNLIYLLKPLLETVAAIRKKDPALYARLEFNFYGNIDHHARELLEESGVDAFKYHGGIGKNEVLKKIEASDHCLLFSAFDHGAAFNTKFYEYLCFKKPIVYLGPEGKLADFIRANGIGSVIHPEMLGQNNTGTLLQLLNRSGDFNAHLDISEFDIRNITKRIMSIIND